MVFVFLTVTAQPDHDREVGTYCSETRLHNLFIGKPTANFDSHYIRHS